MAHSGGPVYHQIQPQAPAVCVSGSGSHSLERGCVESSVGGAGCLCLSSSISPPPFGLQGSRPRLPTDDSDCPGMAKHARFWDLVNLSIHVPLLLPQVENLQT